MSGRVAIDLGTGDGRFVLRRARADPGTEWIGIDPLAESFADSARRAARKPERGGAPNARFVVGTVESLPAELAGSAELVTVNYPWGSLLRAVAGPDVAVLRSVAGLLRPGGRLVALLNLSAADDPAYAERLELPPLDDDHLGERLVPGWRDAGLERVAWWRLAPGEEPEHRTSWGQRLVRGSGRETLAVEAVRSASSSARS
jgi:16S rRNA (adenine(1408)-N(1))-methyltransferase